MKALTVLTLAFAATACASQPAQLVTASPAKEVSALAGEWSGEYRNPETQRWGTIWFKLETARDTAFGDVLMIARETPTSEATAPEITPATPALAIKFVRVDGRQIMGSIEPYRPPECDCAMFMVLRGELTSDRIEGAFLVRRTSGESAPQAGTWWATRRQKGAR
jgi:hypothetical protein